MNKSSCPNIHGCQIINIKDFIAPEDKEIYIKNYCSSEKEEWEKCKRYITKNELNFCPDFVMPDTEYTTDQILDIIEKEY
ncbi:MAG TPA: hypothetical protein PLL66_07340 [Bacteroidales bacterium]|nr:hypothetical protein [Bacteroidales bacterium]